eukprot:TRINITY_DN1978_c0_g1_i2.p1 TRINITY_DN1978_c0_g1~~TRINITY_DN1978_c0_g1_i2.p1  ORF type:complete len:578 (+),score=123.28 TRINITY_DN1978_c0_g1_i2:59-1792(+)
MDLELMHAKLEAIGTETLAWALALVFVGIYLLYSRLCNSRPILFALLGSSPSHRLTSKSGSKCDSSFAEIEEKEIDAIIVGAGVAGSALAFALGKQGRRVLVLERDLSLPDRIVGELLQPGGFLKLIELGLADCVEEIDAQLVWGYALFKNGEDAKLSYPLHHLPSSSSSIANPALQVSTEGTGLNLPVIAGRSFHNGRFVDRLRQKASSLPNVKMEEATVTSLLEDGDIVRGVRYRLSSMSDNEQVVTAPLTFVCDGCFSRFRCSLSRSKVEKPSSFVGLVLEDCHLPYTNFGHVVLANPSPILFYPISSREVRCLVDVPGPTLPSVADGTMAKYLKEVIAPQLPEKLKAPFTRAVEGGAIRSMPNSSLAAMPIPRPGALLMGDAFNMRHPLTGGGMTVALADVVLVRDMLQPLKDFTDVVAICEYSRAFYTWRKPVAATINTLAGALYKVFCASSDAAMEEMRQACFDYLKLGGICASGPVALLSGLNPRPLSLVLHFFSVAVYGVGRLLLPLPTPSKLWQGIHIIQGACKIIFPILYAEGICRVFFPALLPEYYKSPPASLASTNEKEASKKLD